MKRISKLLSFVMLGCLAATLLASCSASLKTETHDGWEWDIPESWDKERYDEESYVYTTSSGANVLVFETYDIDVMYEDEIIGTWISDKETERYGEGDKWVEYEYGDPVTDRIGAYDFVFQSDRKTYWDGREEWGGRYVGFVSDDHLVSISFVTSEEVDDTSDEYLDAINSITLV